MRPSRYVAAGVALKIGASAKDGVIVANKCRFPDRLANRLIPFG
jgi:hypothetical protein